MLSQSLDTFQLEEGIDNNAQRNGDFLIKNKQNRCFFLHKDGLCGMHKALGMAATPGTCRTYPRKIKYSEGKKEVSAMLSCPEIARLFLLNKEACQIHHDAELFSLYDKSNFFIENMPNHSRVMELLRSFFVHQLQNRNLPLADKLWRLANFSLKSLPYYEQRHILNLNAIHKLCKQFSSPSHRNTSPLLPTHKKSAAGIIPTPEGRTRL